MPADITGTFSPQLYFNNNSDTTFEIDYEIVNIGDTPSGKFNVGFYISEDPTIGDPKDRFYNQVINNLDPGNGLDPQTITHSLDNNLTAGEYYVGMFVDDQNWVTEDNEANNIFSQVFSIKNFPNFTGTLLDINVNNSNNLVADVGQPEIVPVLYELVNFGLSAPNQSLEIDFFLSDDPHIDPYQDSWLYTDTIDKQFLNPGSRVQQFIQINLEQADISLQDELGNYPYHRNDNDYTGNQEYYIGMVIDPDHNIQEINEFDNSNVGKRSDYDSLDIKNTLPPPLEIQLPQSQRLYAEHNTHGDTDFDGNGPKLRATPEIIHSDEEIEVKFSQIMFKETKSDWTTFESNDVLAATYNLDDLFQEHGIQAGRFEFKEITQVSESDEYAFPEHALGQQRTYVDNNYSVDHRQGGDLISRYTIFGDRDGGAFGGDDEPWLQVDFNPIEVVLAPQF